MKMLRLMILGGVVLAVCRIVDRVNSRRSEENSEHQLDDALDGTFPASDPTATQDFSIPVNRV
jgi:hypothetical protein